MKQVFLARLYTQYEQAKQSNEGKAASFLGILKRIDKDLNLTDSVDPQVKFYWYPLGISNGYNQVYTPSHRFVSEMGRIKYLEPIYRALVDSGQNSTAVQWLSQNQHFYHPLAFDSVKSILYGQNNKPNLKPIKPIP